MEKYSQQEKIMSLIGRMEHSEVISEGIDIDYENFTVSYNPNHEENVDTSVENNPTRTNEYVGNVDVWSIFKRKKGVPLDGNPLLYALKNEKGWTFKSENDKNSIIKQINLIAKKFAEKYSIGFTILIPSGNNLNRFIGEVVSQFGNNVILVDDVLTKITTEEVWDIVTEKNSEFLKYYSGNRETALRQLQTYLEKMVVEREGYFTRHYVTDEKMRNVLTKTLKLSGDAVARYASKIDGKDILLIDDSISRGQTIKEACAILTNNYEPRSVTVLTLFSKLQN